MAATSKQRTISLRVDEDFYEMVTRKAEAEGRTLASYVRTRLSGGEEARLEEIEKRLTKVERVCPGMG